MIIVVFLVCIAVALALTVAVGVALVIRDPEFWHRSAQAEVDLYRVRRSIQATQMKQDIRRDGRQLRRQLNHELHPGNDRGRSR